jgi:hypothetical protein
VLQPRHVLVANVAPVLAQMGSNAVGARFNGKERRTQWIGKRAAPRIAQGRDMVDVDAKTQIMRRCHYPIRSPARRG